MVGKILGTGSYVPEHYLDNDDLAKLVDTNDQWIRERTGIARRHIADTDTTVSMAVQAARRALESAKTGAEEVELILVSTMSPNIILPCVACEVQKAIGAVNATCFDLNAACTGFLFAYNTAQAYIASGLYKTVLVVGAETLSNLIDWEDRGTCILFGDGSGAALLRAEEGKIPTIRTSSNGAQGDALTCVSGGKMKMDGQAVFKFAVKQVPKCIMEVLEEAECSIEEIDYFILHQANCRIVEAVAKRLRVGIEKFPMNLEEYGNTSSASIPILLDEWNKKGKFQAGQKIVMAGFGAGLSWGASLLEW